VDRRRGDTVELEKPSSVYRIGREAMPELDAIRFVAAANRAARSPVRQRDADALRARGEITPEMEFVAIREACEPEFVRDESRAAAPSSGQRQPSRTRAA
jgi:phosphomethylpyrimidine synthase